MDFHGQDIGALDEEVSRDWKFAPGVLLGESGVEVGKIGEGGIGIEVFEDDEGSIEVNGGGIIPEADIAALNAEGVSRIFTPGASTQEIVDWIRANVRARH